jgi:hypothetical protein
MKANNAAITGGIIRDLITMGYGRSGGTRVQDGDVRGKCQECSCLRVFGTDNRMQAGKILWVSITQVVGKWAPVDLPKPPDHRLSFVLRDGCPDLCCEPHRFYGQDLV